MIKFKKIDNLLILEYEPTFNDSKWIFEQLKENDTVLIKGTFIFTSSDLYSNFPDDLDDYDYDSPVEFILGKLIGGYYQIDKRILLTNHHYFFHSNLKLEQKFFVAGRNISIVKKIASLINEDIYIGGDFKNALPEIEFINIINRFPNEYEIQKYIDARISSVLRNYLGTAIDGERIYNKYLNKKETYHGVDLAVAFLDYDLSKYIEIQKKLNLMLQIEDQYNENQWQNEILQIILILYPKYIQVFKSVSIRDTYYNTSRIIDFLLIDSNGNIDIIEIKRPFNNSIVSKNQYRDNYIPLRELSGTIMQIEKYILNLNRWGKRGESNLSRRFKSQLPKGFQIRITNPNGIIIMGRENQLSPDQMRDFEVIKRKYKNIIDIITYDDLIRRLEFSIELLKSKKDSRK